MTTEILNSQRMPDYGYRIDTEKITYHPNEPSIIIKSAYTTAGLYIGHPNAAYFLCRKLGIKPIRCTIKNISHTIGFSKKNNKWYGWTHRGIHGFTIGDVVIKGDCTNSPGILNRIINDYPEQNISLPIGFEAKTMDDAKLMAMAYTESID